MSEQLHPGLHPDPDSLNAFIEGVLPEHERLQCLTHFAECSLCREVVFLAQESPPAPAASRPNPAWKRWFTPVPVLAAATALCVAVAAVWLFMHSVAEIPAREMVARVSQAPPTPAPPASPKETTEPQPLKPVQTATARPAPKKMAPPRSAAPGSTEESSPPRPTPPSISTPTGAIQNAQAPVLPALPALSALPSAVPPPKAVSGGGREERAAAGVSGISGTVTDPTGAVISGATVNVRQLDGTVSAATRTDVTGQFNLAELPAGRYELQIAAPGFRQISKDVKVQPQQVASVKSQLEVGSVTETVEVTAAASAIQTETASLSGKAPRKKALPEGPRPLPSKLPSDINVTSGKIMLAVDSAGALFVSRNSGKSWKTVKPVWPDKVRSINLANPPTTNATFQLTTDSGAIWLSRDGAHWSAAPAPR